MIRDETADPLTTAIAQAAAKIESARAKINLALHVVGRRDDGYHTLDRGSLPFHRVKVPDHFHINHVARLNDRLLATCFSDGGVRDLCGFQVAARLSGRYLHDGVAHAGSFWLTDIDGSVLELDGVTLRQLRRIDTFASGHFGWCRGLAVTDEHLVVGLTEVRRGRLPRHRWADRDPDGSETSVLLLDRRSGRLLARVDLTDEARHAKLYGILPIEAA